MLAAARSGTRTAGAGGGGGVITGCCGTEGFEAGGGAAAGGKAVCGCAFGVRGIPATSTGLGCVGSAVCAAAGGANAGGGGGGVGPEIGGAGFSEDMGSYIGMGGCAAGRAEGMARASSAETFTADAAATAGGLGEDSTWPRSIRWSNCRVREASAWLRCMSCSTCRVRFVTLSLSSAVSRRRRVLVTAV